MTDREGEIDQQRGLGRVVERRDPEPADEHDRREVEEASEESFPASDPPGYTDVTADDS